MNRIYSKVWNRVLGQWVVVSELARQAGAGVVCGADAGYRIRRGALVCAVLFSLGIAAPGALAADAVCRDPVTGMPVGSASAAGDQVACGEGAVASGTDAIAIGPRALGSGHSAVAIGADARATTSSAVAVGDEARATGLTSTAVGYRALAAGEYSIALGSGAQALGFVSYALGNNAQARAYDVAIGAGALTGSAGSTLTTSIGFNSGFESTNAAESVFIGAAAGNQSTGQQNTHVGFSAGESANGNRNTYSGYYSGVLSNSNFTVAGGSYAGAGAVGDHSVAQGTAAGAAVVGNNNVALGYRAGTQAVLDAANNPILPPVVSFYSDAVNIGTNTQALADGAVAVGAGAQASHAGSVALGEDSMADGATLADAAYSPTGDLADIAGIMPVGEVSVGSAGNERRITNVAAGSAPTDAVNVSQLQAVQTHYYSVNDNGVAGGNYGNDGALGTNSLAAGVDASTTAAATNATAIGTASQVGAMGGTALGFSSSATGTYSIAVGDSIASAVNSIAVGRNAAASAANATAIGGADAAADAARAQAARSTALGWGSTAGGTGSIAVGDSSANTQNAIAIGTGAAATGTGSIEGAVAIGYNARATQYLSLAIGTRSTASNRWAIAVGDLATASGSDSLAVGSSAAASGNASTALGVLANASQESGVAIGGAANATGERSVAIGGGDYATNSMINGASATGDRAIAIGYSSTSVADDSLAIGAGAGTTGISSIAIGRDAQATAEGSLALGADAQVSHAGSVALGENSIADGSTLAGAAYSPTGDISEVMGTTPVGEVSVGSAGNERRVTNVAAGSAPTDAVNVSQLQAAQTHYYSVNDNGVAGGNYGNDGAIGVNSLAAGVSAHAGAQADVAVGFDSRASGSNSIAVGTSSRATQEHATAIGYSATAHGASGVAIGFAAQAAGSGNIAIGHNAATGIANDAIAIGVSTGANGERSLAIGTGNVVDGTRSGAVGAESTVEAADSYSVGNNNTLGAAATNSFALGNHISIDVDNATALGNGTSVTQAGGVALGSNSIANTASGIAGYNPLTGVSSTNTSETWVGTLAAVSVGGAGNTRQITNVAAGTLATDAVNVAQLQAAETHFFSVNSVDTGLGSNYANDGAAGINAIAIGHSAYAPGVRDTVLGYQAGAGSTAGGSNTFLGDHAGQDNSGSANIALGNQSGASVSGYNNTSIGPSAGNNTSGNFNVAIGSYAGPGFNSATAGTVSNTVSIGTYAAGLAEDSVALGAYSIADRAAGVAGYDPSTGLPSTNTDMTWVGSLGAVSVGSASGTRQIINLAAGTEDTDAVNVAQLRAVENMASTGWNAADAHGNAVNIGRNGTVALEGDGNIAVTVGGADDDGVVGIGLNRDLDVDSVTTGDTVIDTTGVAIGTDVRLNGTGLVITGGPSVTMAGIDAGGTVITNVAVGVAPTDAVNVSQLLAVETNANAGWNATDAVGNTANIGPDGTVTFESGNGNIAVRQAGGDDDGVVDITLNDHLDLSATGSLTIGNTRVNNTGVAVGTNVALGSTGLTVIGGTTTFVGGHGLTTGNVAVSGMSNDVTGLSNRSLGGATFATMGRAATEEQLRQVQNLITEGNTPPTRYYGVNSLAGGNQLGEGAIGDDAIALGMDAESEGDDAIALGHGAVASHENSIALGAGSATTVGARSGYQGAYVGSSDSTGEMNIGGRQVTGVAAGSAATDAVNVSQLQAGVTHAITEANTYTDTQIANLDGRMTTIEGDLVDIRGDITDIQGDIVRIEGDITNLDTRVGDVESTVTNLTTTVSQFDNRVTNLERGGSGPFQITQGETYVAPAPTGANASAGGNGAEASGDNSTAVGNQSVASGDNSTAIGQGASASHDNSVALGRGSATTVGAQRDYRAAYVGASASAGEVNIGGRTITGVAPGIAGTDAVNVNQLNAGVDHAINQANAYTDMRFNQYEGDMWNLERGYRGGTASAMAMAGLPQAYLPGKSMLSVAFGGYQGEYGMAFGLSTITDNGRWVYKAQATGNTTRDWGFSVGAGLQW